MINQVNYILKQKLCSLEGFLFFSFLFQLEKHIETSKLQQNLLFT